MQLLNWTRNPSAAAKIAARKEEIYDQILNNQQPMEVPGMRSFLETMRNYKVNAGLQFSLIGLLASLHHPTTL